MMMVVFLQLLSMSQSDVRFDPSIIMDAFADSDDELEAEESSEISWNRPFDSAEILIRLPNSPDFGGHFYIGKPLLAVLNHLVKGPLGVISRGRADVEIKVATFQHESDSQRVIEVLSHCTFRISIANFNSISVMASQHSDLVVHKYDYCSGSAAIL
jgi:hypothetical protein